MPRLISPPLEEHGRLRTPLNEGEQLVFDFFNRHLDELWEIYIQPHLNGLRPDFVLLHPYAGIAVFEVKHWDLDAMRYFVRVCGKSPALWCEDRGGKQFRQRDNPVEKVVQYKSEIMELYCPGLGINVGQQVGISAVITAGVIFSGTTTARAAALFQPFREHLDLLGNKKEVYHPLAGRDALERGDLRVVFPEGSRRSSRFMTPQLADDLRAWLVEPDHAVAQRNPLPLNARQQELAKTRTATGYRRVRGPAGCGKSLSLAARAAHLSAEGKEVLVASFNLTLLHYLRDLAVRYPDPRRSIISRITWLHFHGWCKRVCQEAGMDDEYRRLWKDHFGENPPDPDGDCEPPASLLERDLPDLVGRAIEADGSDVTRYDAILVDEGQDYNLTWWNLLRRVLRPGGEMMLAADTAQDVYDRSSRWTEGSLENVGFRGGGWFHLEGSHRFPPDLVPHLRRFAEVQFPGKEIDLPTAVQGELFEAVGLRWLQVPAGSVVEACVQAVADLTGVATGAVSWADITLLVGGHKLGLLCVDALNAQGVEVAHTFGRTHKEKRAQKVGFWMGDARMKAATIHSFKGWESRAIVVHIGRARTPTDKAAAYVALSRLRRSEKGSFLTVVCSAPELEDYGRTWPMFERA